MNAPHIDPRLTSCDDLFGFVRAKLRESISGPRGETALLRLKAAVAAHEDVRACLSALDRLQESLSAEFAGHRRLVHRAIALNRELVAMREVASDAPRRLDSTLASGSEYHPVAVLRLDVGRLEPVQNAHGSGAAERVLEIVGQRVACAIRAEDTVLRLKSGGFACLLVDMPTREQLSHVACKVLDAVSEPIEVDSLQITVCPSIGIAMCPADGRSAEDLLKTADGAMYRARAQNSGYAFCDARAQVWASHSPELACRS